MRVCKLNASASASWFWLEITTSVDCRSVFNITSFSAAVQGLEWLIVCGIAWYIFAAAKGSLDDKYCLPVKETAWQKHAQKISESVSEDFKQLVRLQEGFIQRSDKDSLVGSLQQTLKANRFGDDEINSMLETLSGHKDRKIPWYAFGVWKRRILVKNHQIRRQVLAQTIKNLETVNTPSQQN